LKTYVTTSTEN